MLEGWPKVLASIPDCVAAIRLPLRKRPPAQRHGCGRGAPVILAAAFAGTGTDPGRGGWALQGSYFAERDLRVRHHQRRSRLSRLEDWTDQRGLHAATPHLWELL